MVCSYPRFTSQMIGYSVSGALDGYMMMCLCKGKLQRHYYKLQRKPRVLDTLASVEDYGINRKGMIDAHFSASISPLAHTSGQRSKKQNFVRDGSSCNCHFLSAGLGAFGVQYVRLGTRMYAWRCLRRPTTQRTARCLHRRYIMRVC